MKREDLKKIIADITDEQISAILNLRSAEIERTNKEIVDLKAEIETKDGKIGDYEKTIADLEKASGDTEALNTKIKELQDAIAEREKADKEAAEEKALSDRFGGVLGENKFVNDFTKAGIYSEFKAALGDEKNKGKSDADVYAAIIKDRSGIFENPNPVTSMGGPAGGNPAAADDAKVRAAMGLPPKAN